MITDQEIADIRKEIKKSYNPIFFYDDDQDGLCAFLLLWRFAKKGDGYALRGQLTEDHIEMLERRKVDLIVILDKPLLDQEMIDKIQIPILHIDHHQPLIREGKHYHYFNPRVENDEDNRPTSYWAYKIAEENMWIATVGIISDWFIPEFLKEFNKEYPGLLPDTIKSPGQALFDEKFGELARIFSFALKGKREERKTCMTALKQVESPFDILEEKTWEGKMLYRHYQKLQKQYEKLRKEAQETTAEGKVLIFSYPSTQSSFTGLIANELCYRNPTKIVIVGRVKDDSVLMSIRSPGPDLPPIINEAMQGINGSGGGHKLACGAHVVIEDFPRFMQRFKEIAEKS